ncbi:tetratricopeptide repeat-containing sensor histidine kinase [Pontibacter sp. H259]|uniref:tetratricopeptide repeat-containing sensor histidine kinase n=1 Tax=Pontibacter sp. H259 TaxID=3133421 RepID=UPI0030C0EAF6
MIATLLVQLFLLIIVPNPKATATQISAAQQKVAKHHEVEELCDLSKANWHSDPEKAVMYGKQAIKIATRLKDKYLLSKAYNSTGVGFYNLGDYNTAADYYYKALKLREALADTIGLSTSYNNLGHVYFSQENYPKAIRFYTTSLQLANQVHDTLAISRAINNLGNVHMEQNKLDVALNYFLEALPLLEGINDNKGIEVNLINLGYTYQKQAKYDLALQYLQRSLALTLKSQNKYNLMYTYRGLAETYQGLKDYKKAVLYGEQSLAIADKIPLKKEAKISAEVLHKIYSATGNYKQAYLYLNKMVAYNDSLQSEEAARQITSYQVKYETAEKEKQNLKLLAEHELHKQEIEHKTIIQYATIGLLALAITVVILIYRGNQRTRRLNKMLSRKNRKVSRYSENIKLQKNELAAQALTLQQQKEELEKLNQLKDKLFSVVAHDLRGPLVSLKSLLHVLAMGKIPEDKFLYFVKTLEAEQQNTLWLVDNLLLWARSQMQGAAIKPASINLHTLTSETLKLLEPQANRKNINLYNFTAQDTPAFADPDLIQLVLRNLISNAIKFCEAGDEIKVTSEVVENDMLQVTVHDTGIGICPEKQPQIFEMRSFTTLGTAREKGSGLGLSMCRDFVESNHGRIWVESTLGEGSIFRFTLPLAPEAVVHELQLQEALEVE